MKVLKRVIAAPELMKNFGRWNVAVVLPGQKSIGRPAVKNDSKEPIVEFYDSKYMKGFGKYGQFTGGCYYLDTILDHDGLLSLYGGEPEWTVSSSDMERIHQWLKQFNQITSADNEGFKVGDILCCEWGYSQSLVNFYIVTRVSNASVQVKSLELKHISMDEYGQAGKVIPGNKQKSDSDVDGKMFRVHPAGEKFPKEWGPWIKINSSIYPAIKWDGKPKTWDTYD